jgi:CO/xanthine dehydrogenase FAD-binding subunit
MNRNKSNTGLAFSNLGAFGYPDKNLIYIGNAGLNYIREEEGSIAIGAATTITDILESEMILSEIPLLAEALRQMAGLTIRNTATLGGNISNASPAGDSLPPLCVYDAKIVTASLDAEQTYPIGEYITGPGKTKRMPKEVLKEIIVPIRKEKYAFIKMGRRKTETLSVINAAVLLNVREDANREDEITDVKIAIGAAGPTVIRCAEAEEFLRGKAPTEENFESAGKYAAGAISPIDDVRSTAWYRKRVASVITKRALARALKSGE